MSKKLMGILMVLGLVMAFALPAFASAGTPDNSATEVSSADDQNEAASEAKEASHSETEAEVENENETGK